ncbi:MAG: glycerate kinase type-2 family protein [Methyloligellaceae bacterium]
MSQIFYDRYSQVTTQYHNEDIKFKKMCITKKQELQDLFGIAVKSAHPDHCLAKYLPEIPENGHVIILGAGKASAAMVRALEDHYDQAGQADRLSGHAVTRHGYGLPTRFIPLTEAGHPVPDENSEYSARKALEIAEKAGDGDLVLVLLSGGASALWSAPLNGLSLAMKQDVTKSLLRSGAAIDEINCVRKHLSRIKGGRLAAAAFPAKVMTFAISDVPHDEISSIGSGPTVGDPTSLGHALDIVKKYKLELSAEVISALQNVSAESLFPDDERLKNNDFQLIATPGMALKAAEEKLKEQGYEVLVLGDSIEGEARDVAGQHAELAREKAQEGKKTALLSGGELTVTIKGNGRGGPNQEYALALAIGLGGLENVWAFAGDTDGVDGGSGEKDDPAGAFIDPETLQRAEQKGLNPAVFLDNNNSGEFFDILGDLLVCDATQTNVNDFRVILIDPQAD